MNAAQGPVVDDVALAQALKDGEIFATGIEVFESEPEVHPDLEGCTLSDRRPEQHVLA